MMTNVGKFNRRVEIKTWDNVKNALGQDVTQLIHFKTVWASIHPLRDKERLQAGLITNEQQYKLMMTYFSGLNEDMFIIYNGKELGIVSICDVDEQHVFYEVVCKEIKKTHQKVVTNG